MSLVTAGNEGTSEMVLILPLLESGRLKPEAGGTSNFNAKPLGLAPLLLNLNGPSALMFHGIDRPSLKMYSAGMESGFLRTVP